MNETKLAFMTVIKTYETTIQNLNKLADAKAKDAKELEVRANKIIQAQIQIGKKISECKKMIRNLEDYMK